MGGKIVQFPHCVGSLPNFMFGDEAAFMVLGWRLRRVTILEGGGYFCFARKTPLGTET